MADRTGFNRHFAPTIGEMIRIGVSAFACCSRCAAQKEIDLAALVERVGPDLCLKNRRNRPCKMTPGCGGYNYFAHNRSGGVILPFRDHQTATRWMVDP